MDNLSAIGLGLALRFLVSGVTDRSSDRLAGTVVGLWEGIALYQAIQKSSSTSPEPYLSYGARLLLDFLFTRSVTRLTVVLLWTVLAMVLSDAALLPTFTKNKSSYSHSRSHEKSSRARRRTSSRPRAPSPISRERSLSQSVDHLNTPKSLPDTPAPTSAMTRDVETISPTSAPVTTRMQSTITSVSPSETSAYTREQTQPIPSAFTSISPSESTPDIRDRHEPFTPPDSFTGRHSEAIATLNRPHAGRQLPGSFHTLLSPAIPVNIIEQKDDDEQSAVSSGLGGDNDGLTTDPGNSPRSLASESIHYDPSTVEATWEEQHQKELHYELLEPPTTHIEHTKTDKESHQAALDNAQPSDHEHTPTIQVNALPPIIEVDEDGLIPPLTFENTPAQLSTFEDLRAANEQATQEAEVNNTSIPGTPQTAASVISTRNRNILLVRANSLRKQALEEETRRDAIIAQRLKAIAAGKTREAFLLVREAEEASQKAKKLHEKAERRFFMAHNLSGSSASIDVHGLKVNEAIQRTERALEEVMLAGKSKQLRVIVGQGKHSTGNVPILRPNIIKAMQKYRIQTIINPRNPGEVIITLPS